MRPARGGPADGIPADTAPIHDVAAALDGSPRAPLASIVARLTGLNALLMLMALITGPVQARVLGSEGRGEIAVILTVLMLGPILLDFGLSDYVARERARGRSLGTVLGTTLPLAIVFALIGVVLAVPLSSLLGQDRPVVEQYVRITLFATPIWVIGWMLIGAARGEQRWSILYWQRAVTAIMS
ncbi:MAG: oligosaccharide flippase family protein, partial [Solirubrobacteraceae bacterium]